MTGRRNRVQKISEKHFSPILEIEKVAKALSDQLRIRILTSTYEDPLTLQQLTQMFGLAPSTISKHLHILEDSGLISSQQVSKWHYFRTSETEADSVIRCALEWIKSYALGDPKIDADAARRAVALTLHPAPPPPNDRIRVLFLCKANACRSQMAEGILRRYGKKSYEAFSAGTVPREISPITKDVMQEIGIDIHTQHAKSVMPLLGRMHFDYLITVCPAAERQIPVFPGVARRIYWPLQDPLKAAGSRSRRLAVFRSVRDELVRRICGWIGSPMDLAGGDGCPRTTAREEGNR
jgi:arsenate reductase